MKCFFATKITLRKYPGKEASFNRLTLSYTKSSIMKYYILLACFAATTLLSSCMKMNCSDSDSLDGTWKMISVKTNSNSQSVGKPALVTGDVIVSFAPSGRSGGSFTGKTPSNSFGPDKYATGNEQSLTIGGLTMTKVAETTWGEHFVDNIREAKKYRISDGKLNITTTSKTLIFTRVQS